MAFPYSYINPNALPGATNKEFQPKDPEVPVVSALGDSVIMSIWPYHELSRPTAIAHQWKTALDAGAVDGTDNAGSDITNPDNLGGTDHHLLKINRRGTFMQFRLVYDDGLASITDPVIQAFGRYDSEDAWQRLRCLADSPNVTLVTRAIDVTDGTMNYTDPDYQNQTIDLNACDEVIIGVKTALAATGDVTTATVQAKLIGGIRSF